MRGKLGQLGPGLMVTTLTTAHVLHIVDKALQQRLELDIHVARLLLDNLPPPPIYAILPRRVRSDRSEHISHRCVPVFGERPRLEQAGIADVEVVQVLIEFLNRRGAEAMRFGVKAWP